MSWKSWLTRLAQRVFSSSANAAAESTASGSGAKEVGQGAIGAAIGEALTHVIEEPMPIADPVTEDHAAFFREYERLFGPLNPSQRSGLEFLLGKLNADPAITDVRWKAYILATVKHECADTFQPVEEYGKGKNRPYGKPDPITGETYYGRGFVQLTHKENYQKLGELIGEDLVLQPWRALDPNAAYRILSLGMVRGLFTNNALSAFINDAGCDYVNARKIVNGLDKATRIAGFAVRIEGCLR